MKIAIAKQNRNQNVQSQIGTTLKYWNYSQRSGRGLNSLDPLYLNQIK
jgi:hypothetical protein